MSGSGDGATGRAGAVRRRKGNDAESRELTRNHSRSSLPATERTGAAVEGSCQRLCTNDAAVPDAVRPYPKYCCLQVGEHRAHLDASDPSFHRRTSFI